MSTTRYASVLGLGFGDCGKGHFIDALARRREAHTVVRLNGGAQAGHNVVTSAHGGAPARLCQGYAPSCLTLWWCIPPRCSWKQKFLAASVSMMRCHA
ncbi:MAG: adenylosuccinate synthetase [Roseimicrobium sp.]